MAKRPRASRAPRPTTKSTEAPPARAVFVAIGLGANLGRPAAAIREAASRLARDVANPRLSPLFRTSPVGGPPQAEFVNAVLVGTTRLAPRSLLARLKELERAAGRRAARRNAPRLLDLDLILYGRARVETRALTIPHPRMAKRLFVLEPLARLAPRRVVPGTGKTVARLLREARAVSGDTVRRLGPDPAFSARGRAARRGAATPRA